MSDQDDAKITAENVATVDLNKVECLHCVILAHIQRHTSADKIVNFEETVDDIMRAVADLVRMGETKEQRMEAVSLAIVTLATHTTVRAVQIDNRQMAAAEAAGVAPKDKH